MNSLSLILIGAASLVLADVALAQSSVVAPSGNTPPSATSFTRPYPSPVPALTPQGAVQDERDAALIDPPVDTGSLDRPIFIPPGGRFSGSSTPVRPPVPQPKPELVR